MLIFCSGRFLAHRLKDLAILIRHQVLKLAKQLAHLDVGSSVCAKTFIHPRCSSVVCFRCYVLASPFVVVQHHQASQDNSKAALHRAKQLHGVLSQFGVVIGSESCSTSNASCIQLQ